VCEIDRCMTGNIAEFRLTPVFSGRETTFACHVRPVWRYKVYDVEYSVVWRGASVNDRRLTAAERSPQRRESAASNDRKQKGSDVNN